MPQIFGTFIETCDSHMHLVIKLSLSLLPIRKNWRNNSLAADFIANYWDFFFSNNDIIWNRQREIRDTISYIANELLENAMKSGYESHDDMICIRLSLAGRTLRFYITNRVASHSVKKFQTFIQELLTGNPHDMYIRQLASNAEEENKSFSQLGFLTILCHYKTRLAWKFESVPANPNLTTITTMVQLAI